MWKICKFSQRRSVKHGAKSWDIMDRIRCHAADRGVANVHDQRPARMGNYN